MFKEFLSKWRYRQYLYSISAALAASVGMVHSSWSSPMIPLLKSKDSPIGVTLTTMESSIVVGLFNAGFFIGSLLTIRIFDTQGRKVNLLGGTILVLIAWIIIFFARSVEVLYVGRIVAGMGTTTCLNVTRVYTAEIADNDNRGKVGFLLTIFNNIGTILGYIAGPYLSYKAFALIAGTLTLFVTVNLLFIPESPFFLIKKHKYEEAEKLLWKLSSKQHDKEFVAKKMETIMTTVQSEMLNKSSISEVSFRGKYKRSLFIHLGLLFILYLSGVVVVRSRLLSLLQETESSLPADTSSLIFGFVQLITSVVSSQVVDRVGRRPLLIVSCSISSFTLFAFALYFYIKDKTSYSIAEISWLPLTCLLIFQISVSLGIYPLPGLVGAELYPINIKGLAISVVSMIVTPVGVVVQIAFEPLNEFWGIYTTFWVFCGCTVLGLAFSIFVLPETKGKSFAEIQMEINPESKVDVDRHNNIFTVTN